MTAKKASDKKAAGKKAVAKKETVKKSAGKKTVTKKTAKTNDLIIQVPQGGQVIRTFNLTPALPVGGQAGDWIMVDADAAQPKDISNIRVSFSVESSTTEQDFERAILIVNLQQNPSENGYWRFALHGVAANPEYSDVHHDVEVEIVNEGATLISHVQVIGDSQEEILFGFVASFTDAVSGAVTIYQSSDPGIGPGRP